MGITDLISMVRIGQRDDAAYFCCPLIDSNSKLSQEKLEEIAFKLAEELSRITGHNISVSIGIDKINSFFYPLLLTDNDLFTPSWYGSEYQYYLSPCLNEKKIELMLLPQRNPSQNNAVFNVFKRLAR